MKNRPHDKKAGIIILAVLLIVSLIETILRAVQPNYGFAVADLGEPFAIAILSAIILFFSIKKKDRVCFVCFGAFISWFMLEEVLSVPGTVKTLVDMIVNAKEIAAMVNASATIPIVAVAIHLLSSLSTVAVGALIVEYLSDGTIYNKAFNGFCLITVLLLLAGMIINIVGVVTVFTIEIGLLVLNNLHRIIMVFMFAFFAYDSAKMQLEKNKK